MCLAYRTGFSRGPSSASRATRLPSESCDCMTCSMMRCRAGGRARRGTRLVEGAGGWRRWQAAAAGAYPSLPALCRAARLLSGGDSGHTAARLRPEKQKEGSAIAACDPRTWHVLQRLPCIPEPTWVSERCAKLYIRLVLTHRGPLQQCMLLGSSSSLPAMMGNRCDHTHGQARAIASSRHSPAGSRSLKCKSANCPMFAIPDCSAIQHLHLDRGAPGV